VDKLKAFAFFWYDFIIGDDWLMAVGVVVALVVTWLAVQTGIAAWLWVPLIVIVVLAASLWRATAAARQRS